MKTPRNSERTDEKDKLIQTLRGTVDSLKDKCLKLSQALDKALVNQREAQLTAVQLQQ